MTLKISKRTIIFGSAAVLVVVLIAILAYIKVYNKSKPKEISYFYENVCGSCNYEGDFLKLFNDEVGDIKEKANFSLTMHNTFKGGEGAFEKKCADLNIPKDKRSTTMLFIGDKYISSESKIKSELRELFCSEFAIKDQTTLKYYFRPTCKDCERIKGFLDETFAKHTDLRISRIDTTEQEPKEKFKAFLTELKIPSEEWEVPFIYYKGKFLSGDKEIEEKLEEFIIANK